MKSLVISVMIGLSVGVILTGCGSQTPKEQVYDITYDALSEGDQKVSPEKAKCIAEKVMAKLSNEEIDNLIKMKKLKDDGYESEIQSSPKLVVALSSYVQYMQASTYECQ